MQKKIVAFAESRGRLDFMNGLKANLRLYAAGKPCRQPFSTIDALFQAQPNQARTMFEDYPAERAY
ncbi:MAG: hypothetical protein GY731_01035 [Gammaproteobacteria bacterium]|nr:hypothetical protein [Gammaproteobacteria bacterium]